MRLFQTCNLQISARILVVVVESIIKVISIELKIERDDEQDDHSDEEQAGHPHSLRATLLAGVVGPSDHGMCFA